MKFTDEQLDLIAQTLHKLRVDLESKSDGIPMLLIWGAKDDSEDGSTVEFYSKSPDLTWGDTAKILASTTALVVETFRADFNPAH